MKRYVKTDEPHIKQLQLPNFQNDMEFKKFQTEKKILFTINVKNAHID